MGERFQAPGRKGERYRAMKARWGKVHTVRTPTLGVEKSGQILVATKIFGWCSENLKGEYAHPLNRKVFNFQFEDDAVLFKLRFC